MTAFKPPAPAMRSGFRNESAAAKVSTPVRCAPSAPARATMLGMAVEEQCDIAPLHHLRHRLGAVDQRALVGLGEAQQHGGDIGRGQDARRSLRQKPPCRRAGGVTR